MVMTAIERNYLVPIDAHMVRFFVSLLRVTTIDDNQGCCAITGDGVYDGLDWLSQALNKKHSSPFLQNG